MMLQFDILSLERSRKNDRRGKREEGERRRKREKIHVYAILYDRKSRKKATQWLFAGSLLFSNTL